MATRNKWSRRCKNDGWKWSRSYHHFIGGWIKNSRVQEASMKVIAAATRTTKATTKACSICRGSMDSLKQKFMYQVRTVILGSLKPLKGVKKLVPIDMSYDAKLLRCVIFILSILLAEQATGLAGACTNRQSTKSQKQSKLVQNVLYKAWAK